MKYFLLAFIIISYGCSSPNTPVVFKLNNEKSEKVEDIFTGGLWLKGKKVDSKDNFMIGYRPGMEIKLTEGKWDLSIIGWKNYKDQTASPNIFEGDVACDFKSIETKGEKIILALDMKTENCLKGFYGKEFLNRSSKQLSSFKKVNFKVCTSLNDFNGCEKPSNAFKSVAIETPVHLLGAESSSGYSDIKSRCYNLETKDNSYAVKTDIIAPMGIVETRVLMYEDENCEGLVKEFLFENGVGETLDKKFPDGGVRRAALSLAHGFNFPELANKKVFNYKGHFKDANATGVDGDLYLCVKSIKNSPCEKAGNFIYFAKDKWIKFNDTVLDLDSIDKEVIFAGDSVTLFIERQSRD